MSIWQDISTQLSPTEQDMAQADALLDEYLKQGYVRKTNRELLNQSDGAIVYFYDRLSRIRTSNSPVLSCKDSSWMKESSFCFVNIRATGQGNSFGNILTAAKLLPGIRSNAIHVGPFTSYDFHCIYAISSVRTVARQVLHPGLLQAGFSGLVQISALVQAIHLTGKTAGFDLEPHVTQFAIPVLEHPEFFRWIRLSPDKTGLWHREPFISHVGRESQSEIQEQIRTIVSSYLNKENCQSLETQEDERSRQLKENLHLEITRDLISQGYWTIPAQTWNSQGIPEFQEYNHQHNYPVFRYLDTQGQDASAHAYNIVTPFAWYQGLVPHQASPQVPLLDTACLEFYKGIFHFWQSEAGFDFARHDSVDHIFDSSLGHNHPLSDRPTPHVLKEVIQSSRNKLPYAGHLAERMGQELEEYAEIGFDSILGSDMFHLDCSTLLKNSAEQYQRLEKINKTGNYFSLCLAVDTHDTGNPGLHGSPLIVKLVPEVLAQRHFMSRFLNTGTARRNFYEVMGLSDLSHGLFHANVNDSNLNWTGDAGFNKIYHRIEDVYQYFQPFLEQATWTILLNNSDLSIWKVEGQDGVLIGACAQNGGTFDLDMDEYTGKYSRIRDFFREKPVLWDQGKLTITLETNAFCLYHIYL